MESSGAEEVTATETSGGGSDLSGISPDLLKSLGIETASDDKAVPTEESEHVETEASEQSFESNEVEEEDQDVDQAQEQSFEIKHDGVTRKMSLDELKEFAQKGFDYTTKTMTLAEERKKAEAEWASKMEEVNKQFQSYEQRQQELNDVLTLKQQWDFYIDTLQSQDPDLFDQIQAGFKDTTVHFQNPVINAQIEQLRKQSEMMQASLMDRENAQIRDEFEKEFGATSEKFKEDFDSLGLKIDRDKVLRRWVDSEDSVEKALIAEYGSDIIKLMKSKGKTEAVKKKVKAQKTAPTLGKAKPVKKMPEPSKPLRKQSWNDVAQNVLKEYAGF